LETTGLNSQDDEIIEFAAVIAQADGSIASEFSMLVKPRNGIPPEISGLTGISQQDVDIHGVPLAVALQAFLTHIGDRPVFFHHAPFDTAFLAAATERNKLLFNNPVHDTLPLARRAWPSLSTYTLSALANHIGGKLPRHRALADAHAALAVLLEARKRLM
jgi:DNA polymerase-3 subunit epsilon